MFSKYDTVKADPEKRDKNKTICKKKRSTASINHFCMSDLRLLHDSAVGSSENPVLVDQGSSAEVETIGELFQRTNIENMIFTINMKQSNVVKQQYRQLIHSYLERDLPGPRTRDGILSVHNPAADRLWFNRRNSTTCYYRTQHMVNEARMRQEALKAGF